MAPLGSAVRARGPRFPADAEAGRVAGATSVTLPQNATGAVARGKTSRPSFHLIGGRAEEICAIIYIVLNRLCLHPSPSSGYKPCTG